MNKHLLIPLLTTLALTSPTLQAQAPTPGKDSLEDAWPTQTRFSPYAGRNFPAQVYWGDTHLHTSMSQERAYTSAIWYTP